TIYYVDATGGNDSNPGTSQDKAWKTLDKVNNTTSLFVPGTRILLKRGEVWNDQRLNITDGGGTLGNPVIFDTYGTGEKPIIFYTSARPVFCSKAYYVFRNLHIKSISYTGMRLQG